ncbi:MAG TPA: hypothetical protein VM120_21140 [Bryobacteraceae bacterium]|nr:hypothetical protein [Bryobacteraceae bacterium]
MSEETSENRKIRQDLERLQREKAEDEAKWHEEVRIILKDHSDKLLEIKYQIAGIKQDSSRLTTLEERMKKMEDWKLGIVGWAGGATFVVIFIWRVFEKFFDK